MDSVSRISAGRQEFVSLVTIMRNLEGVKASVILALLCLSQAKEIGGTYYLKERVRVIQVKKDLEEALSEIEDVPEVIEVISSERLLLETEKLVKRAVKSTAKKIAMLSVALDKADGFLPAISEVVRAEKPFIKRPLLGVDKSLKGGAGQLSKIKPPKQTLEFSEIRSRNLQTHFDAIKVFWKTSERRMYTNIATLIHGKVEVSWGKKSGLPFLRKERHLKNVLQSLKSFERLANFVSFIDEVTSLFDAALQTAPLTKKDRSQHLINKARHEVLIDINVHATALKALFIYQLKHYN